MSWLDVFKLFVVCVVVVKGMIFRVKEVKEVKELEREDLRVVLEEDLVNWIG